MIFLSRCKTVILNKMIFIALRENKLEMHFKCDNSSDYIDILNLAHVKQKYLTFYHVFNFNKRVKIRIVNFTNCFSNLL